MKTLEELWRKTKRDGDCWRWTGYRDTDGYGIVRRWKNGKPIRLSRLSLHLHGKFDLSSDLHVLHKPECRFRDCWNPDHLYAGTNFQNCLDRVDSL